MSAETKGYRPPSVDTETPPVQPENNSKEHTVSSNEYPNTPRELKPRKKRPEGESLMDRLKREENEKNEQIVEARQAIEEAAKSSTQRGPLPMPRRPRAARGENNKPLSISFGERTKGTPQERADELREKERHGTITASEQEELDRREKLLLNNNYDKGETARKNIEYIFKTAPAEELDALDRAVENLDSISSTEDDILNGVLNADLTPIETQEDFSFTEDDIEIVPQKQVLQRTDGGSTQKKGLFSKIKGAFSGLFSRKNKWEALAENDKALDAAQASADARAQQEAQKAEAYATKLENNAAKGSNVIGRAADTLSKGFDAARDVAYRGRTVEIDETDDNVLSKEKFKEAIEEGKQLKKWESAVEDLASKNNISKFDAVVERYKQLNKEINAEAGGEQDPERDPRVAEMYFLEVLMEEPNYVNDVTKVTGKLEEKLKEATKRSRGVLDIT